MQPLTMLLNRAGRRLAAHRRRRRTLIILAAACAAILLAGVVVAQASQNYDLACRSVFDSGGGYRVTASKNFALVDATGQPIGGIVQSSNYGIYGGYIQPYKPPTPPQPDPPPSFANKLTFPFIANAVRIVRGC